MLGRIVEIGTRSNSNTEDEIDAALKETVSIRTSPDSKLNANQRTAIELDYGMKDGEAIFEVRKAMLFYVLKHNKSHRTGDEMGFPPIEQKAALVNKEIRNMIRS